MNKTIITNIRMPDKQALGYVVIGGDGKIEKLTDGLPQKDETITTTIDGEGHILSFAFFDMRVTINNLVEVDSLYRWSQLLFAGGVTEASSVPSDKNPLDDAKLVRAFLSMANNTTETYADIHCYGAMTKRRQGQELAEYGLMGIAGALGLCDGNHNLATSDSFWRILRYAKNFDSLILAHPEEPTISHSQTVMTDTLLANRLGLTTAPAITEALQLQRDIALVELVGCRYHAGPITTRAGVDIIRQAKKNGLHISVDTAPHYFALNETAIGQYLTHAKLSPPLRCEDDRQAIIEAILDGTIDIIASDHKPLHDDKKRLPFALAAVGMASIETMLPLMITILHGEYKMPLAKLLAMITDKPRGLCRLLEHKSLAVGNIADIVLLDDKTEWTIDSVVFHSPSKNTPLDGYKVRGRVVKTFKKGKLVFSG
ncbi:MAG: dihydroorotase [Alphaproteobacteria bacterium]